MNKIEKPYFNKKKRDGERKTELKKSGKSEKFTDKKKKIESVGTIDEIVNIKKNKKAQELLFLTKNNSLPKLAEDLDKFNLSDELTELYNKHKHNKKDLGEYLINNIQKIKITHKGRNEKQYKEFCEKTQKQYKEAVDIILKDLEPFYEKKEEEESSKSKWTRIGMIGKVAYNTVGSIVGVKFLGDLGLAMFKKGDIYNYFEQKKEVKEEKSDILESLDIIANVWEKRKKCEGKSNKEERIKIVNKALKNAIVAFKDKVKNSTSLDEKQKKEFQRNLALITFSEKNKKEKALQKKDKETKEVLSTYLHTKIKGTKIAKDALNTAFTATGLMALRGAMYGGMALAERAQKANIEFSKKELSHNIEKDEQKDEQKNKKARILHIIKDTTVNAAVENGRALLWKGKEKGSKHKGMEFVQALGTVLRGFGIGSAAYSEIVNQGISGSIDESLNSFEDGNVLDAFNQVKDNFAERLNKSFGIFRKIGGLFSGGEASNNIEIDEIYQNDELTQQETSEEIPEDAPKEFQNPPYIPPEDNIEGVETFVMVDHLGYQGENNIWDEIEAQIPKRKFILQELAAIGDNSGATETHLVDYLKDQIFENPEAFGLPKDIDIDEVTADQMEAVNWDKVFNVLNTEEGLNNAIPNLSGEAKESIIENNRLLNEYAQKTNSPIDSESQEEILSNIKEAGSVDKFLGGNVGVNDGVDIDTHGEDIEENVVEGKNIVDKDLSDLGSKEKSLLHYLNQYNKGNGLPEYAAKVASEEGAELLMNNVAVDDINQYPDIQSAIEKISLDKLRESLSSFSFLGFGGPNSEELSEGIADLARATGEVTEDQSDIFSLFISQGEDMNEDMVKEFVNNNIWDGEAFNDKVNEFTNALEDKSVPDGQELVPRYLDTGGDSEPALVLVHKLNEAEIKGDYNYEYIYRDGSKIQTSKEYLKELIK